ncbi:MAG TPA: helix-turn-helix transcriptional regulator [Candidatus Deferrimicrobium sp.]|nr:helix-turn-helix transcriptional regulator [Candidatus Kapabacteria bacterium]HLP61946.1 helix-turn-helix transcriptional regulator [Candidatus Deferrimicrobium sp.]
MKQKTKKIVVEAGQRLEEIRKSFGHSRQEMASRIGITRANLYRNEIGFAFPRLDTLIRLHEDFGISLDWLLFNKGTMHIKESQSALDMVKQSNEQPPEIRELLAALENDPVLRFELLASFYKYKKNQ